MVVVSGWEQYGYDAPAFGLTSTKAGYWHRKCPCGRGGDLAFLVETHLKPAGVQVLKDGGNYLHVTWPGIVGGRHAADGTDVLYAALIGGGNLPPLPRCSDCGLQVSAVSPEGWCSECRDFRYVACLECDCEQLLATLPEDGRCPACAA